MVTEPSDTFLLRLGSKIALARQARALTQARLAEDIGVDARSLQRIEAGRAAPSLERLRHIASALGVTPGSLIDAAVGARDDLMDASGTAAAEERRSRDEAAIHRLWKRVPEGRKPLALKLMRVLASEPDTEANDT